MWLFVFAALGLAGGVRCKGSSDSNRAAPPKTELGDLSGQYAITSASNPGGSGGYQGSVRITKEGDIYKLVWAVDNSPPYQGVAIPMDQTLAVGWGMGARFGVAVYQVRGGKLFGRWATANSGPRSGVEELEGPEGLQGTYRIVTGKAPEGGGSYTGTVSILPSGDTFTVTWTLPTVAYSGVGIRQGDLLIVGWGEAGQGAGVVGYQGSGSKLTGVWATPGGTVLGSEVLTKR
jgi:eukaryotic-like serine/threonine-protein kinase